MSLVFFNGRYLDEKSATVSVRDAGLLYGEGVYETLRTYRGLVMHVEDHLQRLKNSAEALSIPLPPLIKIADWLQRTVDRNGFWKVSSSESRVRLTVTGGVHGLDERSKRPTILITVEPLAAVPRSVQEKGVSVVTYAEERVLPSAKTIDLVPTLLARRFMKKKRAYEVLLIDRKGRVTEGSIANFFIVKRGKLITPKSYVLEGTTRERVVHLARDLEIEVIEKDVFLNQLYAAKEVFICNTLRGIVPVVRVDGRIIADRKVGGLTRCLMAGINV